MSKTIDAMKAASRVIDPSQCSENEVAYAGLIKAIKREEAQTVEPARRWPFDEDSGRVHGKT